MVVMLDCSLVGLTKSQRECKSLSGLRYFA